MQELETLRQRRGRIILRAAIYSKFALVDRLLESFGCDFDTDSRDEGMGGTIVHWAAFHGNVEVVSRLLACGADLKARDSRLHTPLMSAAWMGETAVVRLLIETAETALPEDLSTAIRWATFDNGYVSIPLLLAAGAPVGLPEAIVLGDMGKVRTLLEQGACVDWRDPANGYTLLHLAFFSDRRAIAQLLLQYGAPIIAHAVDPLQDLHKFGEWLIPQDYWERRPIRPSELLSGDLLLLVAHLIEQGRRTKQEIAVSTGIPEQVIEEWWQTYRLALTPPDSVAPYQTRADPDRPNSYCIIVRNETSD